MRPQPPAVLPVHPQLCCQILNKHHLQVADDGTIVGQISNNDKTKYRRKVEGLATWCNENYLSLDISKTKELIIDFRKKGGEDAFIYINRTKVEGVKSIKFPGVMITNDLSCTSHADATVKKAQQLLFFFRRLRKFVTSIRTLTNFYRCTVESILKGDYNGMREELAKAD
eukprot:g46000.t1